MSRDEIVTLTFPVPVSKRPFAHGAVTLPSVSKEFLVAKLRELAKTHVMQPPLPDPPNRKRKGLRISSHRRKRRS